MPARSVFAFAAGILLTAFMPIYGQMTPEQSEPPRYRHMESPLMGMPDFRPPLPSRSGTTNPEELTVSLHALQHRVPGRAAGEYNKARKAHRKGNYEDQVEHLKKAIEIDPEFAEAHNDLAAAYLSHSEIDRAIQELEKATRIDPHMPAPYGNLAVAYMVKGRYQDAESSARRLVDLDRIDSDAHMIMAFTLVVQKKYTDETRFHLQRAKDDCPQAKLLLACLLASRGDLVAAKSQIKSYLATDDAAGRQLAVSWLKMIDGALPVDGTSPSTDSPR